MNGYDLQRYEHVRFKCNQYKINIRPSGNMISLTMMEDGAMVGAFENIEAVYSYMCGFESGFSRGKLETLNKQES